MSIFMKPEEDSRWKNKHIIGIVWMSPDEFLSKVPSIRPSREDFPFKEFKKLNPKKTREEYEKWMGEDPDVKYYEKKAKKGEKFQLPMIDISSGKYGYKNKWMGHEGRHRVFLAKKLGEDIVPILVWWWYGYRGDPEANKILEDIKYHKQGDWGLGLTLKEQMKEIKRISEQRKREELRKII